MRECNNCDWTGPEVETLMLSDIGPLCPECLETTYMLPKRTETLTIHKTQDPKYGIKDNRIVNSVTGKPIPDDEPIFILRAKDAKAAGAIFDYLMACNNQDHQGVVRNRWLEFCAFKDKNPELVNEPDS